MSEPTGRTQEGDVSLGGNALRSLTLSGLAVAFLPTLLAFAWLGLLREPTAMSQADAAVSQAFAQGKAKEVSQYVNQRIADIEALANRITANSAAGAMTMEQHNLPAVDSVTVIPLNDLGTVNLAPGLMGIDSHIGVDLVRQAFGGDLPPAEAVMGADSPHILIARAYGAPAAGVILVKLPVAALESRLIAIEAGHYQLLQSLYRETTLVAGTPGEGAGATSAEVPGTPWRVAFSTNANLTNALTPGWIGLAAAAGVALISVLIAFLLVLIQTPRLVSREVSQIIESSELRAPIKLTVPPLLPLAKLLRQLSLLHRRKIVTRKRDVTKSEPPPETTLEEHREPAPTPEMVEQIAARESAPEAPPEAKQTEGALPDQVAEDGIPDYIFRETCIRGTRSELSDELTSRIGKAIAVLAKDRGIANLLIAHDARPGSNAVSSRLIRAFLASGLDIIDLGEVPAPILHYATHETDTHSGIMISGGDGDDAVNGLELVFEQTIATEETIQQILSLVREGTEAQGTGRTIRLDVTPDYVDKIVMDVALALPLKIVVDHDFGASADLAPELFEAIDCEVVNINADPHQRPDKPRELAESLVELGKRVVQESADIGVVFDLEGDRMHLVSDTGEAIATDRLLMFLAQDLLERNPGTDVVFDIAFSRQFAPFVTRAGGRPLLSRGGRAFVRGKMQESQALLGGELSGHVFMAERWYPFNDPFYAVARVLELLSGASASFSELMSGLPNSLSTPEMLVPMSATGAKSVMTRLEAEAEFPGARIAHLDGLRLDYANGWGLVRRAPERAALAFRFEANDAEGLERIQAILKKAVADIAPDIALPF